MKKRSVHTTAEERLPARIQDVLSQEPPSGKRKSARKFSGRLDAAARVLEQAAIKILFGILPGNVYNVLRPLVMLWHSVIFQSEYSPYSRMYSSATSGTRNLTGLFSCKRLRIIVEESSSVGD